MSKIVRFHETGGADLLKLEELPLTEPGEAEVRLKVEAIGLNRAEVMFRQGQYLETPQLPSRLGYEAARGCRCHGRRRQRHPDRQPRKHHTLLFDGAVWRLRRKWLKSVPFEPGPFNSSGKLLIVFTTDAHLIG